MGSRQPPPEPPLVLQQLAAGGSRAPEWRALLGRADGLAAAGRLPEALPLYRLASRHRQLRAEQLGRLVECLARGVRLREGLPAAASGPQQQQQPRDWEVFGCRKCQGFLFEPVSLPCGHTFCKKCLERERPPRARCVLCREEGGAAGGQLPRVNVILSNLLAKWFPCQVKASQLRHEGNRLYEEKKLQAALQKYNEALSLGEEGGGGGGGSWEAPSRGESGSGEQRLHKPGACGPAPLCKELGGKGGAGCGAAPSPPPASL